MSTHRFSDRQIEGIAGINAGLVTTLLMHPLDMIKIRLQLLQDTKHKPFLAIRTVISEIEKSAREQRAKNPSTTKIRSLLHQYYRGIGPNLFGNVTAWSLYFTLYAEFKHRLPQENKTALYFTLSTLAGLSTGILTNPLWVLKTRILATGKEDRNAYKSIFDGVKQIYAKEGIRSFWKGSIPGLIQVFQGSLQFTFYDQLKNSMLADSDPDLTTNQYVLASAAAKVSSMSLMYPVQVIKSRLQNYNVNREHRTIRSVTQDIWYRENGVIGFYKGFGANLVRVVPATCITFVVYETVRKAMKNV